MYLCNKNILKYVEIVGSEPKSMILNTEGRSNQYELYFIAAQWELAVSKNILRGLRGYFGEFHTYFRILFSDCKNLYFQMTKLLLLQI